jgi:hypothetical protein
MVMVGPAGGLLEGGAVVLVGAGDGVRVGWLVFEWVGRGRGLDGRALGRGRARRVRGAGGSAAAGLEVAVSDGVGEASVGGGGVLVSAAVGRRSPPDVAIMMMVRTAAAVSAAAVMPAAIWLRVTRRPVCRACRGPSGGSGVVFPAG